MVILFSTLLFFITLKNKIFFLYAFEKQEIYFHYIRRMPYNNLTYLYILRIDFFFVCMCSCVCVCLGNSKTCAHFVVAKNTMESLT